MELNDLKISHCLIKPRLAQVGYIKLFIICIFIILDISLVSLILIVTDRLVYRNKFSLVALSEIYPTCAKQNVFREVIDDLWLSN